MTVFILRYSHKHGEDITVYASYKAALKGGAEIVEEYIDDVDKWPERREEIVTALKKCDYDAAWDLWAGYQEEAGDDEELLVTEHVVYGFDEEK